MADINKETDQDVQIDRSDLDAMPEKERKETEEILDDLATGGKKSDADGGKGKAGEEEKPAEEEKPKPEEKPKEGDDAKPKPEADKKGDEGKGNEGQRRAPKLVPAWILEKEKDQASKRESELKTQLEEALKGGKKAEDAGKPDEQVQKDLEATANTIAEKFGREPEEILEILKAAGGGTKVFIPPEVAEGLKAIEGIKAQEEIKLEEAAFSADFDKMVLPLIKKEYGDDVPAETILKIKEDLKAVAYDADYEKVPYATIYKGRDEFRGVIPEKGRGAEHNRGGSAIIDGEGSQAKAGTVDWERIKSDDSYELSDEELRKLSDEDFDKYGAAMDARDKAQRSRSISEGAR